MFSGEGFGSAVHQARVEVFELHGNRTNTWGAYQCYGDPHYRLVPKRGETTTISECHYIDLAEAIVDVNNLTQNARIAVANKISSLRDELETTYAEIACSNEDWLDDPDLNEALGRAYGEVDLFEQAVQFYEKAFHHPKSQISVKSIEQLANLRSRWAVELQNKDAALKLIDDSINQLRRLKITMGDTPERLALIGSAYKRCAQISRRKRRREALVKMESYYRRAWELKKSNTYPLLNMLIVQGVRYWNGIIDKYPPDWEDQLKTAQEMALQQKEANPENFWLAIGVADYKLTDYLSKGHADPVGP